MKRMAAVILFCFLAFCLSGCVTDTNIPSGYTGKEEHFDKEGFQDYADYCKYFYKDAAAFENNPDYRKVTERDIAGIKEYFDYFEMCMDGGRADEYDFESLHRSHMARQLLVLYLRPRKPTNHPLSHGTSPFLPL